jgi:O-antigen ligase
MTMMATIRSKAFDLRTLERLSDWLAVGVAVSLPWSTSATGILTTLWLFSVLPTLAFADVRRELLTPAGGLPVLLWALALAGMLWADVSWHARLGGFDVFQRLLFIPLLLARFRRSELGFRVFFGYFWSIVAILLCSYVLWIFPAIPVGSRLFPGVPVKDYILQSEEFLLCAFALMALLLEAARSGRWRLSAMLAFVAALLLANIAFVIAGRTAWLVAPVLALVLGGRYFGWKGTLAGGLAFCALGSAVAYESPYMRARLQASITELQAYEATDANSSTGLHIEYLRKSLSIVASAPIFGHGTGSIEEQFRKAAVGKTGTVSVVSVNPHNQIFSEAIQLGVIGAGVLIAMWIAHFMLFRGGGFVGWIGVLIMTDNVVSSLFNSHLNDFTQGWAYVFGVGVAGGMMLQARDRTAAAPVVANNSASNDKN